MEKIAIICEYANRSVWNALKQHIDLIKACHEVDLIVPPKTDIGIIGDKIDGINNTVQFNDYREIADYIGKGSYNAIFAPSIICVLRLHRRSRKFKNFPGIYLWVQGTLPDESYMRNGSWLRKTALTVMERYAFSKCDGFIFVSDAMEQFYRDKYKIEGKPSINVPCLCDFPYSIGEKKKESYVYIGGLADWQCINETLQIYKKIRTNQSTLDIITYDVEKARQLVIDNLEDYQDVNIYTLTDREKIRETLARFEYGFLIRKESPVNYVASPIKFLEYISCGVNVIMTDAVPAYSKLIKEYRVGTVVDIDAQSYKINAYSDDTESLYRQFSISRFESLYNGFFSNRK